MWRTWSQSIGVIVVSAIVFIGVTNLNLKCRQMEEMKKHVEAKMTGADMNIAR